MKKAVTPYNDGTRSKKAQVEEMFDNIALRYDFLNHLLSLGIDKTWRKKAVDFIGEIRPASILDVATGTGDFAFEALRLKPERIIGYDLSDKMLERARAKAKGNQFIEFLKGDSEQMPFADDSFDAVTVGFGVRNFENLERGLLEIKRVMRPGGRGAILEISQPHHPLVKTLYKVYFNRVLPAVGRLFSRDAHAYTYLPESVQAFPEGPQFKQILEQQGFRNVRWTPLTLGTCAFYAFEK